MNNAEIEGYKGKEIGQGLSRTVYEHGFDDNLVIKEMRDTTYKCNLVENAIWNHAPEANRRILIPSHGVTKNGKFQIQSKATPIRSADLEMLTMARDNLLEHEKSRYDFPGGLVWDTHDANSGIFQGNIVMIDTGVRISLLDISSAFIRTSRSNIRHTLETHLDDCIRRKQRGL
jgi:hypothetical protein